ncbi:restriction endonuclease subunit S [Glycomyces paridis]|uniref:Type I restriction modification DNA specificity domain-containing protein n=1 Tax=Glycomyces paridis TaxID=2126555 RepID=A0A4S8P9G2_9ACTN|nr:restriction endonuclease subunit S [Glycomyces paridis]THV24479.1 hypothetical protein E9998_20915 [Glycomyces paridis]
MSDKELPPGWAWSTLGEVGEYFNGRGFKKSEWSTQGLPIIRIQNLTGSGAAFNYFSGELDDKHLVKDGDLLISWAATLGAHIWRGSDAALNQHIFKVDSKINRKFLYYLINYKLKALQERAHGSGMVHLTRSKFEEETVPVPPLAEQERIVDVLDGHLSRLDSAIGDLQSARCRAIRLRKSMEHQGISGQLSGRMDTDQPVQELLDEVDRVLAGTSFKRRKVREGESSIGDSLCPKHWAVRSLGSLCTLIEYGTSAKTGDGESGSTPVLRMGNIQSGRIDASVLKYLPGNHPDVGKLLLEDGDLLFNRTNSAELVGKSAVYRSDLGPMTFASYLIRCRLVDGIEPEWVNLFINSPAGRRYIDSVVSQQVGQANVNGTKLANFPVPVPAHEEQLRILDAVSEWETTVAHAFNTAEQAMRQADRLRKGLLESAFAGDLVPQDPADEPASAVLDRIRAERAAQPKLRRGRAPKKTVAVSTRTAPSVSSEAAGTFVQEELGL